MATVQDSYTLEQAEEDIATLRGQITTLQEMHALITNGLVPATTAGQAQLYGESSGLPGYVTSAGLRMNVPGAQYVFFPNNTVTAISLTNLASGTYIGGDAGIGSMYEVEAWGNGTQGSTKQSLQLAVVFGGTTMASVTLGTVAFSAVSQAFRWRVAARVICHTTGASGTWTSYINAVHTDFGAASNTAPGNSNVGLGFSCESTGTTTKDTTATQTLSVQAAWGSATGAPTLTSQVAVFKRLA